MDVFAIGGGSGRTYWNCTKPDKDGFSNTITGDVVEIAAVPRYVFGTQTIDRWDDGNPKVNMRITLLCPDGEERCFSFKFSSSSQEDKWCRMQQALFAALRAAGLPGANMAELQGLNITLATQQPPAGFQFGAQNPRPFSCQVNGRGTAPFKGMVDEVSSFKPEKPQPAQLQPEHTLVGEAQRRAASAMGFGVQQPQQRPVFDNNDIAGVYDADIPF